MLRKGEVDRLLGTSSVTFCSCSVLFVIFLCFFSCFAVFECGAMYSAAVVQRVRMATLPILIHRHISSFTSKWTCNAFHIYATLLVVRHRC